MSTNTQTAFLLKKIIVIACVSILNFMIGSFLSYLIHTHLTYKFKKDASSYKNLFGLAYNITVIIVLAYVLRQISERIPLPFASESFDVSRIREVKSSIFSAFTLFLYFKQDLKPYKHWWRMMLPS